MLKIRCSALPLAASCPASQHPVEGAVRIDDAGEPAMLGSAVHWLLARAIGGNEWADIDTAAAIHDVDPAEVGKLWRWAWQCWQAIQGDFPEPKTEVHLVTNSEPQLSGHIDVLSLVGTQVRIADWKSGRVETDHDDQLRGYAMLALAAHPECQTAYVCTISVRRMERDARLYTRDQLENWWAGLSAAMQTGMYRPGNPQCFSGDTRFITERGIRTLREMCGKTVRVLNRHGHWEDGTIQPFGRQQLVRVTFDDGTVVRATPFHRWWKMEEDKRNDGWKMTDQRITTLELDRVPIARPVEMPDIDPEGVRHGFVFGDGYRKTQDRRSQVRIMPHKEEIASYFDRVYRWKCDGCLHASALPWHYKDLPTDYSPAYARGFVAGLLFSDGCVCTNGSPRIYCEGAGKAHAIAEIARVGGCVVGNVRLASDKPTNYSAVGTVTRQLMEIRIKPATAPILRSDQLARLKPKNQMRRLYREVVSIEADQEEDVFCAVVPGSESFTLASGIVTSNCLHCPRRIGCPARQGYIADAITSLVVDGAADLPAEAGNLYDRIKLARQACDQGWEALRMMVHDRGGSIDLKDGRTLTTERQEQRKIDPKIGLPILRECLDEGQIAECLTIGTTKVKDAVARLAGRGQKGAVIGELMERLEGAGALVASTIEKLVARKSTKVLTGDAPR